MAKNLIDDKNLDKVPGVTAAEAAALEARVTALENNFHGWTQASIVTALGGTVTVPATAKEIYVQIATQDGWIYPVYVAAVSIPATGSIYLSNTTYSDAVQDYKVNAAQASGGGYTITFTSVKSGGAETTFTAAVYYR
jgi:hypothetical protein